MFHPVRNLIQLGLILSYIYSSSQDTWMMGDHFGNLLSAHHWLLRISGSQYFEELYNYYTIDEAWHLCDPNAEQVFKSLRKAGVKVAVVSNFNTRLRPLLRALKCDNWFDVVAVSAEANNRFHISYSQNSDYVIELIKLNLHYPSPNEQVEADKPNPMILKACELLGVQPEDDVHVGDDRTNKYKSET